MMCKMTFAWIHTNEHSNPNVRVEAFAQIFQPSRPFFDDIEPGLIHFIKFFGNPNMKNSILLINSVLSAISKFRGTGNPRFLQYRDSGNPSFTTIKVSGSSNIEISRFLFCPIPIFLDSQINSEIPILR